VEDSYSRWDYVGSKEKFVVVPNGIDIKQFDAVNNLPESVLADYGLEKENFVLYMGRLSFLKGVDYLIEAFKKVEKRCPNLKLVIAGKGDFEPYLKKIAHNMKSIVFLGFIDSIRLKKLLYQNSLAVVLPSSVYETSPMVILEAMSCSKPVIATNIGGNPYMIRHGENGFLSKPRDSENLANLISVLCENETSGRKMGRRGRKLVENEFTSEKMVNRTLKIFESLMN
jgi:glycosyltransferase involved in cell wall biosynthesis